VIIRIFIQMINIKIFFLTILLLLCLTGFGQNKQSTTVHFDFNQFDLTKSAITSLDSFINTAKTRGNILHIQLNGHCDAIGNDAYNDRLSKQRVQAVKNYLLKSNIAANSFTVAKGHGKREPLNSNATEEERLLNRRVEIVVDEEEMKVEAEEKKLGEQIENTTTNNTLVLKNINFIGGMHRFLPESYSTLKELLDVMLKNKNLRIQVQGHICCQPGNEDGYDGETRTNNLSELRAKAVMDYLIENGVDGRHVSYVGLGHSQPIYPYPEKTVLEQTLNRRVEIKIINK
jgi:outer membrane protein OmpA-like peptidoglycan-associated protein